jgi:hypothetical protein
MTRAEVAHDLADTAIDLTRAMCLTRRTGDRNALNLTDRSRRSPRSTPGGAG